MSEFFHISVLLQECLDGLNIKPDGIYVDGTLGGAGHSSQIAARLTTGRLIGIDRDPVALKAAGERLAPYGDRVTLVHSNFCEIRQVLEALRGTPTRGEWLLTFCENQHIHVRSDRSFAIMEYGFNSIVTYLEETGQVRSRRVNGNRRYKRCLK